METYGRPLKELRSIFTLSEMVITAWRSQETYFAMKKRVPKVFEDQQEEAPDLTQMSGDQVQNMFRNMGLK